MAYLPDVPTTLARYLEAWNEPDPDRRWTLVHAAVAPDAVYTDPHSKDPVEGQPALTAFIGLFRAQYPHRFEPTGPIDGHHQFLRMPWRLVDGDDVMATGLLVASLDRERRLVQIVHFVDPASKNGDVSDVAA